MNYFSALLTLGSVIAVIFIGGLLKEGFLKDKTVSVKSKILVIVVMLLSIVIIVSFFAGSCKDNDNSWGKLTEEEKDWYRDNYGNGQYDKYKDAINDYNANH